MKSFENKINLLTEQLENINNKNLFLLEMKKIGIDKLPYSYSSLKQFIDPETMSYHYNKHYKGYVDKLNSALNKKDYGDIELEDIVKGISRFSKTIRNNAGGAFNHALFWKMLTPKTQKPSGEILDKIKNQYETLDKFKTEFEEIAKSSFGSGWVWLVLTKRNTLKIVTTANQDNPLMNVIKNGGYPLLGLDLWEHAYYLKYRNKRDEYINNFWKCVNWEFVNKLYTMKTQTKLNENVKPKSLLIESKSEKCSTVLNKEYRIIFDTNPNVKHNFKTEINQILKEVFPKNYYDKNEYGEGQMAGIYDLESPGRSVINKLNTNYSGFCILVQDINKVLKTLNKPEINIIGKTPSEQIRETDRLIKVIKYFKERIFSLESATFQNIITSLTQTNVWGEQRENYVVSKLKTIFGDKNVSKVGALGSSKDMIGGIDCEVNINGITYTTQIKPFTRIERKDNTITVYESSGVKDYKTDWVIFGNKNDIYIFDNKNTKIVDGNFVFPETSLIRHIY